MQYVYLSLLLAGIPAVIADCKINLDRRDRFRAPLLLKDGKFYYPNADNTEFVNEDRIMTVAEGTTLELYCHRYTELKKSYTKMYFKTPHLPGQHSLNVTCQQEGFTREDNQEVLLVEAVKCNNRPKPWTIKTQTLCSPVGYDQRTDNLDKIFKVDVGWKIRNKFTHQIEVCIDENDFSTLWTRNILQGNNIDLQDKTPGRVGFVKYSKSQQKKTVENLLGTTKLNNKEIVNSSSSSTSYFAKGHLSPDAAFIYNAEQDATYFYFNAAPQFQAFNNGNWKSLEIALRDDVASKLGRNLEVTTGVFGHLSYPDTDDIETPLYLWLKGTDEYVPVPEMYWKKIIDKADDTGVVIIGHNDIHASTTPIQKCTNRCAEISWVDWDIEELDKGYMYCCSVEDAVAAIPTIPNTKTNGLLLAKSEVNTAK